MSSTLHRTGLISSEPAKFAERSARNDKSGSSIRLTKQTGRKRSFTTARLPPTRSLIAGLLLSHSRSKATRYLCTFASWLAFSYQINTVEVRNTNRLPRFVDTETNIRRRRQILPCLALQRYAGYFYLNSSPKRIYSLCCF